jgi:hypothetical protein
MESQFVVINDSVINISRVLAVEHKADSNKLEPFYNSESEIPERLKACYVQVGERWEIDPDLEWWSSESYVVMFDTGKALSLKPVDGQPLIERFRNLSKPSCGKTQTASEDAT